jgi:TetR/AcrR family transcriptional regulator of autoinduction and epiphytic fitness
MSDTVSPVAPRPREADPRIERSRHVIFSAALELLGEVGYSGLTIEAVAARAGVGKSTIYRHWSGKLELVEEAIRTLKLGATKHTTGSFRDRLVEVLTELATNMADSTWSNCVPAIIEAAERDPEVLVIHRRLAYERRQQLVDLLAEGVGLGDVRRGADLELLAESLIGPIVMRRLMLHEPLDPADVPVLVDQLLG